MSLELSVYCNRAKLPTAEQWSKAMKKDGFDVSFIRSLNWKKPGGGVTLNGEETHFELSLFPNDPDEDPPKPAAKFDSLVAFRFGSTGGEAALLAAAALSRITKGYLYDPDMDAPLKAADAIAEARRMLAPAPPSAKKKFDWSWDDQSLRGAQWVAACEQQLRAHVHPDYRHNNVGRANWIEFVRRDEATGLWLSQNVVRRMFQGEDEYAHCFAVVPAAIPNTGPANSILKAGPRWSHNEGVLMQIAVDLKGGYKHRSKPNAETTNFKQLIHNAKVAEQYLYPHYRKVFTAAAPRLLELYSVAAKVLDRVGPKSKGVTPLKAAHALDLTVKVLNGHRDACINLRIEGLRTAKRFAAIPATLRDACIVAHNIEQFAAVRAQLPEIIETVQGLRGKRRRR